MKYVRQFMLILMISFCGDLLQCLLPHTSQCIWICSFVCRTYDRNDQAGHGERCSEILNRDYAAHVYSGRSRIDLFMGCAQTDIDTYCSDYGSNYSRCHGIRRQSDTVGNTNGKEE